MEKGDRLGYSMGLAIGYTSCSWSLMGKQKAWFRFATIGVFIPFAILKQRWWSTGNANIKKDFLSIRCHPGGGHLLWRIVLISYYSIWVNLALLPDYWSLARCSWVSVIHYDKVVVRLGGQIEKTSYANSHRDCPCWDVTQVSVGYELCQIA